MKLYTMFLLFPISTMVITYFLFINARSGTHRHAPRQFLNHSLGRKTIANPPPFGIQHCFFINMDHRKDRLDQFLSQMQPTGIQCQRVPAVNIKAENQSFSRILETCFDNKVCPGRIGCQLSHLKALDFAIQRNLTRVIIFEDDFVFQPFFHASNLQPLVETVIQRHPGWDVLALSISVDLEPGSETVVEGEPVFISPDGSKGVKTSIIHSAQTSAGFMFRDSSVMKLYRSFINQENCDIRLSDATGIDKCMKPMQKQSLWIGLKPQIGIQKPSFSDIEHMNVNYKLARR